MQLSAKKLKAKEERSSSGIEGKFTRKERGTRGSWEEDEWRKKDAKEVKSVS